MKTSHLLPYCAITASVSALGTGPGPYDDLDPFISANNRPNATGSVYLSAVNMSTPPSTRQPELWRASINITEVTGAKTANSSQVITNSVISLDPMGNLIEGNNSNTDWTTCAVIITSVALNATVRGKDDTGDCTKTFGEECVTAWTRAVGLARATAHGSGACGGMNLPRIPDACRGSFDVNALSQDVTNASNINNGWLYQDSAPHDASNKTYYQSAATRIWPLMILQTAKNSWNGSYITNAKLSCLRATNATSGSEKIGDVPGAASVIGISKALVTVVGLLGVISLLGLWDEVSA